MTQFVCTHITKEVEEDSYENGCDPTTRKCVMDSSVNIAASSLSELFDKIASYCGLLFKDGLILPEEGDEVRYVTFNRLENDVGDEPTQRELDDFKNLKRLLWLADFTFIITARTDSPVTRTMIAASGVPFN